jgi:thioredoxin 1
MLPLITECSSVKEFSELLQNNPGIIIIKFGAEWCGPCKQIEHLVHELMNKCPQNIQCCVLDVDDCFELYSFMKTRKMVKSIPSILCYYRGNLNYTPDDGFIGASQPDIISLFDRCFKKAYTLAQENV